MTQELAVAEPTAIEYVNAPMAPADVVRQVGLIQQVMKDVMKENEHYGTIPGCGNKPTLLQPGAQVLALTFRFAPSFVIEKTDLGNGHREYMIRCQLASIQTGQMLGSGVGICSTMESKYRWRKQFNETEVGPVPKNYWDIDRDKTAARNDVLVCEYGPGKYRTKKTDGTWKVFKVEGDEERFENPDIADTYNTVLKIATKRAFVHAVLNTTAASDMFTQDIEDLPSEVASGHTEPAQTPAQVVMVDEETLTQIRDLRDALEVSDQTYGDQLAHYGASVDTELSAESAKRLLTTYKSRKTRLDKQKAEESKDMAEKLAEATGGTVTHSDDDIQF